MSSLQFNEPLSWRAGKAIPVADLLTRLQKLARELQSLPQEEGDRQALKGVSQDLANGHLLGHRDKGVRAWTACCLVEIFRLCAPDAPFTQAQLKEIFTLFVTSIIPALADPSNAYNSQHIYVLNSLAEVKSIILLTDLTNPDALLNSLFITSFDIVSGSAKSSSGDEVAEHVKYDITRLLVTVIDEAQSLAGDVVDVIIAQFLRVDPRAVDSATSKNKKNGAVPDEKQGTLLPRDYSPAYNMSKAICDSCTDKMARYISQYFSEVIMDASGASTVNEGSKKAHRRASFDDSDDEGFNAPSGEDMKELSKAHKIVRELWRACPDVLQNVIPQLEVELSAESVSLRTLATETLGDVAAGIGIAGPPPSTPMDPAAYPPATLTSSKTSNIQLSVLQTPISLKPFSQTHSPVYDTFLGRRQDKSAVVRAAWTTAIGRILITSGGGIGLSEGEEQRLMGALAHMLGDADEQVRSRAVKAISQFSFSDIILRVGSTGGLSIPESPLSVLSERMKDKKHAVRVEAMKFLGRIWGAASGELEENNEKVASVLGDAPTKIFDAFYTGDLDIHALIDHVLFESLLPLSFPPLKSKPTKAVNGSSQVVKDSQAAEDSDRVDTDRIRVRRILTLLRRLDDRSRKVFYSIQNRQVGFAQYLKAYLQQCEVYNGGVMDKDEDAIKLKLTKIIQELSKRFPEAARATSDLWAFAKKHDRRNYQLIRFCMEADSDYHTIQRAIKELTKRIQSSSPGLVDTLTLLLYRCSLLVYNKSHIPAIMDLSKADGHETASVAHELLTEISSRTPEVLKAHVHAMCKDLEQEAPSAKKAEGAGVVDSLKACAGFAKKFPAEIPKDRKFLVAMNNFALYSDSPRAAKHAVSILIAVGAKKDMYAKDLVQKCTKDWKYGTNHFLARLATLAQLNLLAPEQADEESDAMISIAVNQILLKNRSPSPDSGYEWSEMIDEETTAKELALKILVNRIRSCDSAETLKEQAAPVFKILNSLITTEGDLSKKRDTPATQKSRLRLLAANLVLKLCSGRRTLDDLFTNQNFNSIALVAQDPLLEVRSAFISKLKKYLGQTKLGNRWYTIAFILAYEPDENLKDSTLTWVRARASALSRQAKGQHSSVMEGVFARLLSLLAHHPDYSSDTPEDLVDFTRYILFFLSAAANETNLSLVFHVAQRVKQTRDAISQDGEDAEVINDNLYHLSDLAQATIRRFEDFHDWAPMQTWPGKLKLPSTLFAPLPSHEIAQDIADKNYLPEEAEDLLDKVVKSTLRPKSSSHGTKRKAERARAHAPAPKKMKVQKDRALPIRKASKTPKRRSASEEIPSSERRRSGRVARGVSYREEDSEEDDAEMEGWDQEAEDAVEEAPAGKEESSEVEEEPPVQRNGKKVDRKPPPKNRTKAASSSSPVSKGKLPASKGRRTRAAAAAGGDEMEA